MKGKKQKQMLMDFEAPKGWIALQYGKLTFHEPVNPERKKHYELEKKKAVKKVLETDLEKRQQNQRKK